MVTEITAVVNAGHLSCQNGAYAPLSFIIVLRDAVEGRIEWGNGYGQDKLIVPSQNWSIAEELLLENKMLYKVLGRDLTWQNAQAESVRKRLNLTT